MIRLLALGVGEAAVTSRSLKGEPCRQGPRKGPWRPGPVRAPTLTSRRKVLGLGMLLVMVRLPVLASMENEPSSFPGRTAGRFGHSPLWRPEVPVSQLVLPMWGRGQGVAWREKLGAGAHSPLMMLYTMG